MSSWQFKIFKFILKLQPNSATPERILNDLPGLRKEIAQTAKTKLPPSKNLKIEKIKINGLNAQWLRAEHTHTEQVLYWFHGGWYCLDTTEAELSMLEKICDLSGCSALMIDYRLAPEHPYPAALEDCAKGYDYLLDQGIKPENVVFGGFSVGGALSIATVLQSQIAHKPLPRACISLSGALDLTLSGESWQTNKKNDWLETIEVAQQAVQFYLKDQDPKNPLVSPIFADYKNFPPLLLAAGGHEVFYSDSLRLYEKAKKEAADVTFYEAPEMIHISTLIHKRIPEARKTVSVLADFLKRHR